MAFNPNQPRDPAGTSTGGQWTPGSGSPWSSPDDPPPKMPPPLPEENDDSHDLDRMEDWELKEISDQSVAHLNDGEEGAIATYSGAGSIDVNNVLRGTGDLRPGLVNYEMVGRVTNNLDKVFARTSLSEDLTTFRALGPGTMAKMVDGAIFTDPGYTSTSANFKYAAGMKHDAKIPMQVNIPAGSKALPIGHLSRFPQEQEVLINRGARFQVARTGDKVTLTLLGH